MLFSPPPCTLNYWLELSHHYSHRGPLPNASLFKYSSSQKITNALVTAYYTTDANSAAIFKYYDEQLKQHGWQLQGTTSIKDWDRDLGGESADYCKDDYGAELFYDGLKVQTYSLDMSWGDLGDCKQFRNNQNNITPASP